LRESSVVVPMKALVVAAQPLPHWPATAGVSPLGRHPGGVEM